MEALRVNGDSGYVPPTRIRLSIVTLASFTIGTQGVGWRTHRVGGVAHTSRLMRCVQVN